MRRQLLNPLNRALIGMMFAGWALAATMQGCAAKMDEARESSRQAREHKYTKALEGAQRAQDPKGWH